MSAREWGIRSVMATASLSSDWHIEEPSGEDGTGRARRHPSLLPLGGVRDCEELRTPSERDLVYSPHQHLLGMWPGPRDLGFPVCEVEVVSRMGTPGLSTGPGHRKWGCCYCYRGSHHCCIAAGATFAGCGVSGLSDLGRVMVCQASLARGQMMSSR